MSQLLDAIRVGDNTLIMELLLTGADVNVGEFYMTPLQLAIMKENKEAFDILIQAGADINKPEETKQWRPLTYAAKYGNLYMLEKLLDLGAAVDVEDSDGRILLDFAVHGKHVEVVKLLVQRGANIRDENTPNRTSGLMYTAMMTGCVEMVVRLRAYGLNFETIHPDQTEPGIFRLIQFNLVNMLETIIELGANVNIQNSWGATPLFRCSDFGASVDCIHALLKSGANPNKTDNSGETALVRCIKNGHFEKVKALLDWGARVDYVAGRPSLIKTAVERGYRDIVKLLVYAGCNLHQETWMFQKLTDDMLRHITTIQWISECARTPMSLKWYSRLAIRNSTIGQKSVQFAKLPLPSLIRDFLFLPNLTDLKLHTGPGI